MREVTDFNDDHKVRRFYKNDINYEKNCNVTLCFCQTNKNQYPRQYGYLVNTKFKKY